MLLPYHPDPLDTVLSLLMVGGGSWAKSPGSMVGKVRQVGQSFSSHSWKLEVAQFHDSHWLQKSSKSKGGGSFSLTLYLHLGPQTLQSLPMLSGKQKHSRTGQMTEERKAGKLKEKKGEQKSKKVLGNCPGSLFFFVPIWPAGVIRLGGGGKAP